VTHDKIPTGKETRQPGGCYMGWRACPVGGPVEQKIPAQKKEKSSFMGILSWIILGGIAGWLASIVMKRNDQMGCIMNIAAGVVGAFVGAGCSACSVAAV
jgi:hypothetical protein